MPKTKTVHLYDHDWKSACGIIDDPTDLLSYVAHQMSDYRHEVTCGNCKRTFFFEHGYSPQKGLVAEDDE